MENPAIKIMESEIKYMSRCLQLAQYGTGYVAPNPMVGAVLVHDGNIIGEGYHQYFGQPHAEPNAINSVKNADLLEESTLYVNLEPCSHFGKTPPCANLIISKKIPRVIIGTLDPNPKVAGRGVAMLQQAGINVKVGVLENECRELNKRFFIYQEQKRPYILLKWAQTKDGFIDHFRKDSEQLPLQISNPITRQLTHKMRSENQAILVSTNTVLLDNPSLTVRDWSGKNPVRIAIDRQGRIPDNFNLLDGSTPTLIFTESERTQRHYTEFIHTECTKENIRTIIKMIYERSIHSVMVEGGASLLNCFIDENLWDEANVEISNQIITEGIKAPQLFRTPESVKRFNGNQWLFYKNH